MPGTGNTEVHKIMASYTQMAQTSDLSILFQQVLSCALQVTGADSGCLVCSAGDIEMRQPLCMDRSNNLLDAAGFLPALNNLLPQGFDQQEARLVPFSGHTGLYALMPFTIPQQGVLLLIGAGFTADDQTCLNELASFAAARIENNLLLNSLQQETQVQAAHKRQRTQENLMRQTEDLSTLYRLSLLITSGLEFSHILDTLHQELLALMPIDVFYVALYNAETDLLNIPVYYERDEHGFLTPDINIPAFTAQPAGFSAHIIRTCAMIHIADTQDPEIELPIQPVHLGGVYSRSYLGIPLMWQNQIIGLLSVQSYQPNAYSPDHIRLIQAVAVQSAIAIQNVRLYEQAQAARKAVEATNQELQKALIELEHLATTDKLTGAYNRRKFDEILSQEMKRALRFSSPLSLIMFDIDHFKTVNDSFGHLTGDKVLAEVVRLVINCIRSSDTLTRWGGEEFLVLSPGNDTAQAIEMAERLRRVIAEAIFPSVSTITVSLGVCEFCPGDTTDRLLNRVDNALYNAKHNGRNCVGLPQDS